MKTKSVKRKKARVVVSIALRNGSLIKPTECQLCGKAGYVESHHASYDHPLSIAWLCEGCHGLADKLRRLTSVEQVYGLNGDDLNGFDVRRIRECAEIEREDLAAKLGFKSADTLIDIEYGIAEITSIFALRMIGVIASIYNRKAGDSK